MKSNILKNNWQIELQPINSIDESRWKIQTTSHLKKSTTVYLYCCNKSKLDCQAKMRVRKDFNDKILNVATQNNHSISCLSSNMESANHLEQEICNLHRINLQPREIHAILQQKYPYVSIKRCYYEINRAKNKLKSHQKSYTIADLEVYLQNYINSDPETRVLSYKTHPLCILCTSQIKSKFLVNCNNLHVDATYRLTIYNFPIVVIGFTDYNKKFHLTHIAICENESVETYNYIFQKINEQLLSFGQTICKKH